MAIEPLHSSKLLMCAQIVQCVGVCEKKEQERRRMKERGKEGGRERRKRNVKVTLFCLENQRESKLTAGSIWSFGYAATSRFHPTPADVHITLKD